MYSSPIPALKGQLKKLILYSHQKALM